MHPAALLDLAAALLREVLKLDAPADGVVSAFFRRHRELGARERHALAETAYAVLRRKSMLQHLARSGQGVGNRRRPHETRSDRLSAVGRTSCGSRPRRN